MCRLCGRTPIRKQKDDASAESAWARAFEDALNAYADQVMQDGIEDWDESALDALRTEWEARTRDTIRVVAAAENARHGWDPETDLVLDNPHTVRWLETRGSELVRQVTATQRDTIRRIIHDGIRDHFTPAEQARALRAVVPLLPRQVSAVEHMIASQMEQGVSEATVLSRAQAYARRMLQTRCTTIARTEIIRAEAAGLESSWAVAEQTGVMPSGGKKRWIARRESRRICPTCRDLAGKETSVTGAFPGGVSAPPAHVLCRCTMGLVFRA